MERIISIFGTVLFMYIINISVWPLIGWIFGDAESIIMCITYTIVSIGVFNAITKNLKTE